MSISKSFFRLENARCSDADFRDIVLTSKQFRCRYANLLSNMDPELPFGLFLHSRLHFLIDKACVSLESFGYKVPSCALAGL